MSSWYRYRLKSRVLLGGGGGGGVDVGPNLPLVVSPQERAAGQVRAPLGSPHLLQEARRDTDGNAGKERKGGRAKGRGAPMLSDRPLWCCCGTDVCHSERLALVVALVAPRRRRTGC